MKNKIAQIEERINRAKKILIISHISPDGDSIGSILGFGFGIRKKYSNKIIDIAVADMISTRYSFLELQEIYYTKSTEKYDLVFVLDCGDIKRAGMEIEESKIINIDHHITNTEYGNIAIVNPKASSTSEIIMEILKYMNIEIDKVMAESLYTGITTDTGSFKYSNTTATTHRLVAELIETGIDINKISTALYQNRSFKTIELMKEAIENMEVFFDRKIVFLEITESMLKRCNATAKDSDMLVEFLRDILGVEISITTKPMEDEIKVSMRSKLYADVSKIAKKFGGGGHIQAAGFTSSIELDELKKLLIEESKKEIKK